MKFHFHLFLLTLIVYCLYYLFSDSKKNSCSVLQELPSSSSLQRQKWQHFHEIFSQNETHGVVKFSQFKFSKKKNITSINLLLMRKGTHKFTVSSKTQIVPFFSWNQFHVKNSYIPSEKSCVNVTHFFPLFLGHCEFETSLGRGLIVRHHTHQFAIMKYFAYYLG